MVANAEALNSPVTIRPGTPDDAEVCGNICFEAFRSIAEKHHFPPDFPSADVASGLMASLLGNPGFFSVVAEVEGRVVGSNFLDERNPVAGVGPITVDASMQNLAVGRQLMQAVIHRSAERNFAGIRLLQAAYHGRSLSLYTKLGFAAREPLSTMQGPQPSQVIPGYRVRQASHIDLPACNALCQRVHGHSRGGELKEAITHGTAKVVEHDDRIVGYTTQVAFFGHAIGENNTALKALITSTESYAGPGFHVPTRNTELFHWCLANGLRVVQPMTLMSMGLYNEPAGAFLPSILY